MNVLMDTVQMVKELRQLAWTVRPDDKRVIHIAEPAGGLVVCSPLEPFLQSVP
jgi:hypothetical protein